MKKIYALGLSLIAIAAVPSFVKANEVVNSAIFKMLESSPTGRYLVGRLMNVELGDEIRNSHIEEFVTRIKPGERFEALRAPLEASVAKMARTHQPFSDADMYAVLRIVPGGGAYGATARAFVAGDSAEAATRLASSGTLENSLLEGLLGSYSGRRLVQEHRPLSAYLSSARQGYRIEQFFLIAQLEQASLLLKLAAKYPEATLRGVLEEARTMTSEIKASASNRNWSESWPLKGERIKALYPGTPHGEILNRVVIASAEPDANHLKNENLWRWLSGDMLNRSDRVLVETQLEGEIRILETLLSFPAAARAETQLSLARMLKQARESIRLRSDWPL